MDFIMPSLEECDRIEKETDSTMLSCVFGKEYFAHVRQQIDAISHGKSDRLSSIYAILQDADKRKLLTKFLELIQRKLKNADWNHLCKRLAMLDQNTDLEAVFEVTILGNLILQLPEDRILLNARTVNKKNVDAKIRLVARDVYLEITFLGPSARITERRARMQRHGIQHATWMGIGVGHGRRIAGKVREKSAQFCPAMPNVLVMCVFEVWDRMPRWEHAAEYFQMENVGQLYVFDRTHLRKRFIGDTACTLTQEEENVLVRLLNGKAYSPIGYE